jgi:hypothetical protein
MESRKKHRSKDERLCRKTPPDRFFSATVLDGRLHVDGIQDRGPWEASRLHRWPEDHLDPVITIPRERPQCEVFYLWDDEADGPRALGQTPSSCSVRK